MAYLLLEEFLKQYSEDGFLWCREYVEECESGKRCERGLGIVEIELAILLLDTLADGNVLDYLAVGHFYLSGAYVPYTLVIVGDYEDELIARDLLDELNDLAARLAV